MALRLLKSVALGAILCMSAEGKKFSMTLEHDEEVESFDSLAKTSLSVQEHLLQMKKSGITTFGVEETLELMNQEDAAYQGILEVGTPPKKFKMIYDTGSSNVWVPDFKIRSQNAQKKTKYDQDESSTYGEDGREFKIQYGSGPVAGTFGTETMQIGSLTANNMTFGMVTDTSGLGELFSNSIMEGIVGMGYETISLYNNPTLIDVMAAQGSLDEKTFAFFLGREGAKGELTFGGVNEERFTGDIAWHKVVKKAWWVIEMNSISIGSGDDAVVVTTKEAIVDSGTSLNTAPSKVVKQLGRALKCIEVPQVGLWVKGCDKAINDPDLTFNLGGKKYTLSPREYYMKDPGNGICVLTFLPMDMGDGSDHYLLGDVFMKKFYTVHDKDNHRVGFADAVHPEWKVSDKQWASKPEIDIPELNDDDAPVTDDGNMDDLDDIPEEAKELIQACVPPCMDGANVNIECVAKCVEAGGPDNFEREDEEENEEDEEDEEDEDDDWFNLDDFLSTK